ncbi:2-octaprenyl-6-methoxyphenol hydroxylase [Pseudoalteromonas holothuriae]|uniref:2-octaprenyl-6-methoxyphenol hydroxylase n=1 Tax=Pseudoalteromonas holothuriae TaxID=2963714 RepID=A0ABN8UMQ4_9GAMM|nr:2-octaprenyl-6-methoxyphenyl hydroxylase [Pseudoalteromonas sp. CIP111951]CAH9056249.1 2-octaprenyl-6-methoxyphenol hydroxylase [Pseudoalteromonas sp. CIP111951]
MQQFDILIVGGGMAGATAALAISKLNADYKVGVVEAFAPKDNVHPSFDDRSIAFAQQSVVYLQSLGLFKSSWTYAQAIKQVNVSDRGHFGKTQINHDDYQCDALGYVVEVNPYGAFLHQQLNSAGVTLFCPASVTELKQCDAQVEITLSDAQQLSAKLLIIADGAQSPTRTLLKFDFSSVVYEQGALIANIQVQGGHNGKAFERFTEHGPMALLPMSDDRYSLVWCMNNTQLEPYLQMAPEQFVAQLQQAFGYRAGLFTHVGMRSSYPLMFGRVDKVVSHRCLLIGNAAHAIHPIAGQGFNLGLRDIQCLMTVLANTDKQELGNYHFTRSYELSREQDINMVMTLTDSLVRLFSNSSRLVALGRSCGLFAMALSTRLKAPLAKQLMGHVLKGNIK